MGWISEGEIEDVAVENSTIVSTSLSPFTFIFVGWRRGGYPSAVDCTTSEEPEDFDGEKVEGTSK